MSRKFKHSYDFDPAYGFDIKSLLRVEPGEAPADFSEFWKNKYTEALNVQPYLSLQDTGKVVNNWRIFDCHYDSTGGMRIGGWLLLPVEGRVNGALISAHGYGGIDGPDTSWNLKNTALFFPCSRGIGRSAKAPVSSDPQWHVLHNIHDRHQYIIGGCVQDLWCSISALQSLFPQVKGQTGLLGSSFGGGLGVIASAFDKRISRCYFHVPTFGNLSVRIKLPTMGSTDSLSKFEKCEPEIIAETLPYFDASCAAEHISVPSYWALALFDPFVAPPGQFSIYNACSGPKELYQLSAGHFSYDEEEKQYLELRQQTEDFFAVIGVEHAS